MARSIILASLLLLACTDEAAPGATPGDSSTSGGDAAPASTVCEPGADQTCNDNPEISSFHGTCLPDGTCQCREPFEKNEATGRCL